MGKAEVTGKRKLALVIGNSEYQDANLPALNAPIEDVKALVEVLKSPDIGDFDQVKRLINQPEKKARKAIARFFREASRRDMLLLYFSGHGLLDEVGDLYLAAVNTKRNSLEETAIEAAFVRKLMNKCRAKEQILILDCCYSGAFARTENLSGITRAAFRIGGRKQVIMAASSALEWSLDGKSSPDGISHSVFTRYLVEGLATSQADSTANGQISAHELHNYVYRRVTEDETTRQTPHMISEIAEDLIIAKSSRDKAYDILLYSEAKDVQRQPDKLVGRGEQLDAILPRLDAGEQLQLTGFGGTGKTALAAALAVEYLAAGSGPILWINAGNDDADTLLEGIGRHFDDHETIRAAKVDARAVAVRKLLEAQLIKLVVIDDLKNHAALPRMRPAIPPEVPLLVTSRRDIMQEGNVISLQDLSPEAALELLGLHANQDYTGDPAALELCQELGHHPLGIVIAGTLLGKRRRPPAYLLDHIRKHNQRAADLTMPPGFAEEGRGSVKVLLDETFAQLAPLEQAVLGAFGALFEPKATATLLAAFLDHSQFAVEAALDELMLWNLVGRVERTDVYFTHQMIFDYARSIQFKQQVPDYTNTVATVHKYVTEHPQNFALLRLDRHNILEAAGAAGERNPQALVEIMSVLTIGGYPDRAPNSYFMQYGHTLQFLEHLNQALDAIQDADVPEITRHYLSSRCGSVYAQRGEYEAAITRFQQALQFAPSYEDQVHILGFIAKSYALLGDFSQADAHFQQGLDIAGEHGDEYRKACIYEHQAFVAGEVKKDFIAARDRAQQAAVIYKDLDKQAELGWALLNLGAASRDLNDIGEALHQHKIVLNIAGREGDQHLKIHVLWELGQDYHVDGEPEEAQKHLAEAYQLGRARGFQALADEIRDFMQAYQYNLSEIG